MKRPAVIIDVDDTLAETQVHMLAWVNQHSLRQYVWEELDHSFREGRQPEYENHIHEYLGNRDYVEGITPFEDALEAIRRLHEAGYELHIASARKTNLHGLTEDWLKEHGFIDFIDHIHPRSDSVSPTQFKSEVARLTHAVAAFDDTYDVGEALAATGTHVYLINKPWNIQLPLKERMERSTSFAAAVTAFLASN